MSDHPSEIEQIRKARSLEEIQNIVRELPAKAIGDGGVLYSRPVGNVSSEIIAKELAEKTHVPIINNTARAKLLSDPNVEESIKESANRIYRSLGESKEAAEKSAEKFLYGDAKAAIHSPTSLDGSLWGEASKEFAGSLRGDVKVIASAATPDRVLGQVEIPEVLRNPHVTSLGGQPIPKIRTLYAQGGVEAVLPEVQAQFIEAAPKGIFVAPENTGPKITKVALSKEFATSLGADATKFAPAAELTTTGLARAPIGISAPAATLGESAIASEAVIASRGLHPGVVKGLGIVGAGAMVYDAYTTAEQYRALSAQGNQFGADALLHHYEGRTAGGLIGGIAAGAVAGSETGPGALVTGAIGGVFGAFAGDKIATAWNEHQINHQTGHDGVTYAYDKGQWTHTSRSVGLDNHDLPTIKENTVHAPAAQLSALDYQRTTAVTALALANPGAQDTKHITLDHSEWRATHDGWAKRVELPGVQTNSFGIPSSATVNEPADAKTSAQLNQIAANRQFNNDHYAENVSKAYVMDYYGKGWNQNGPLPDTVTHTLKLPSEQHIKDPVTGNTWTAIGKGSFTRNEVSVGFDTPVSIPVKPNGDELARLGKLQEAAAHTNASYGSQLIAQKYEQLHATQQHAVTPAVPSLPEHVVTSQGPAGAHQHSPMSPSHGASPQAPPTAPLAHAAAEHAVQAVQAEGERAHIAPAAVSAAARHASQSVHAASQHAATMPPAKESPAPAAGHAATQAAKPHAVATAPILSPPLDPPSMRDFRHAEHPLNPRYQMFRDALGEQGFHAVGRPTLNAVPEVRGFSAEQKDRLAAGFTAQLGADTRYHTEIQHFDKNGEALLAVEHPQILGSTPLVLAIDKTQTLARTPEAHAAAWRARELPEPQAVNTARPDPRTLSPDHPGHLDHPRHAMFENARAALSGEYARWGMQKGAEPLDRETMQVMTAARERHMDDVGAVRLWKGSPDGRIGEYPQLTVYETPKGPQQKMSEVGFVPSQTLQQAPPVHQAAQQFQAVDQQATQQVQQAQQLQAQVSAQGQQGPAMGGPGMGR